MVRELPVDDRSYSAGRGARQQRGVRGRMHGLRPRPVFLGAQDAGCGGFGLDALRGGRAGVQAGGDEALDEAGGQRASGRVEEPAFEGCVRGADEAAGGEQD